MTNILDDYALISPLRSKNNWLKLYIVGFGLLAGVFSQSPITPFFIAICMTITTVFLGKTPLKLYFKILLAPFTFVIPTVLIIAFSSGSGNEIFSFDVFAYKLVVSTGSLNMALLVLARTVGGMTCLFFLALTTPMVELFSVLKTSKLPDSFIEISMMMYRYIFVFLDVAMSIKYAQTVRLGYKDFRTSFNSMAMLVTTLFIRSWEQGEKIYLSMNSRCYDGKMAMFESNKPLKVTEIILAGLYFISVIALSIYSNNHLII